MSFSRVDATLLRGGLTVPSMVSASVTSMCSTETEKIGAATADKCEVTYASFIFLPPPGSALDSSEGNTLFPCSPHVYAIW